jgi:Integrase core domain
MSWIIAQGIGTALIEPGKPWQNNVSESFNGKFRDECLSFEFRLRAEANVIIETWRRHSKDGEQSRGKPSQANVVRRIRAGHPVSRPGRPIDVIRHLAIVPHLAPVRL